MVEVWHRCSFEIHVPPKLFQSCLLFLLEIENDENQLKNKIIEQSFVFGSFSGHLTIEGIAMNVAQIMINWLGKTVIHLQGAIKYNTPKNFQFFIDFSYLRTSALFIKLVVKKSKK